MDQDDRKMTEGDEGERLLVELGSVINRADPVPDHVTEYARAAYGLRTLDAELAELVHDSLLDAEPAPGVRGSAGPRQLSFESPKFAVELEVTDLGRDGRRLVGQLVPPGRAAIVVEQDQGEVRIETAADELGRFVVDGLRPGGMSVRCRLEDGTQVKTEWTQL